MNDNEQIQANVKKQTQVSAIWIIPIIALLIGAWMLFQFINSTGPEITLRMPTAEGIKVGKTEIKSLNVKVGVVTAVHLSENYNSIVVKARMDKNTSRMLNEDTLFWVVKPRIGSAGISGLDTLLSGSYIQLQPGHSEVEKRDFTVLELPPVAPPDAKGLRVVLTHQLAGKLDVGDPVMYKGFIAGRVEKVNFDVAKEEAFYQLFIFQPYDDLINSNTRFWLNSGLSMQLGADGVKVHFDSLESLISGGVSFGLPEDGVRGEPVTAQLTHFQLFEDMKQMNEQRYSQHVDYIMLFKESVRGLHVGAPVEYRGIQIGTVSKIPFHQPDPTSRYNFHSTQIPILIRIDLGRIYKRTKNVSVDKFKTMLQTEFQQGLRAELKTGSLLTGALYVGIDYDDVKQPFKAEILDGYEIFPTRKGGFTEVQKQFTDLLRKVNALPMEKTVAALNRSLANLDKSLSAFDKAARSVNQLTAQKETQSLPAELQASLQQVQKTLDGFSPNSVVYQNLNDTLKQFEQTMAELQPVLRQINEKPNSLVFGEDHANDPIPAKGGTQ